MGKTPLDKIEVLLLYMLIAGICFVFLAQLAFLNEKARRFLVPVERLEGIDLKLYNPQKIAKQIQDSAKTEKSEEEIEKMVNEYGPAEEQGVIKASQTARGMISIKLLDLDSAPYAKILLNNEDVADFTDPEASIFVSRGDYIQIDGSTYLRNLRFKIYAVSSNLAFPQRDTILETNASIANIGTIRIK